MTQDLSDLGPPRTLRRSLGEAKRACMQEKDTRGEMSGATWSNLRLKSSCSTPSSSWELSSVSPAARGSQRKLGQKHFKFKYAVQCLALHVHQWCCAWVATPNFSSHVSVHYNTHLRHSQRILQHVLNTS